MVMVLGLEARKVADKPSPGLSSSLFIVWLWASHFWLWDSGFHL